MIKTELSKTEMAIREQLRDKFAMAALQGMLAGDYQGEYGNAAYHSYRYADEMLKAREE